MRQALWMAMVGGVMLAAACTAEAAGEGQPTDWQRFYAYPYVYYPHNFQAPQEFNHMYYRYPQARQIPVYNKDWHNFYPTDRKWHKGAHFNLDIF